MGAFAGTYILNSLLSSIGLGDVSLLVAGVALLGGLISWALLPEPRGRSLEELTEDPFQPSSAVALGLATSRVTGAPRA